MAPPNFHEEKTILKSNKMGESQVMTKVGGFFQPIWKICAFVKLDHETPSSRDEHKQKKIELPPPRKNHGWIPQKSLKLGGFSTNLNLHVFHQPKPSRFLLATVTSHIYHKIQRLILDLLGHGGWNISNIFSKWWCFIVIYHGRIRNKSPTQQNPRNPRWNLPNIRWVPWP